MRMARIKPALVSEESSRGTHQCEWMKKKQTNDEQHLLRLYSISKIMDAMGKTPLGRCVSTVTGVFGVVCYLVFALVAFGKYAGPYGPTKNWLSDLGSTMLNPAGAAYYNTGIILTGLSVLLFFLGFSQLRIPGNRKQYSMLLVMQLFGVLGSFSLIMSAIYPIDALSSHRFWSISLYVMLGTAFAFSVSALRYHRTWPRWLLVIGVLVALVDILSGVFGTSCVMEWITVALFLFYVSASSIVVRRI